MTMTLPPIDLALQRYQAALTAFITLATTQPAPDSTPPRRRFPNLRAAVQKICRHPTPAPTCDRLLPPALEVMAARNALQTLLQSTNPPTDFSGLTLTTIADLDQQLKEQAEDLDRCLKTVDWQTSFAPSETAWWWSIKPKPPNPWWNQDWLWQAVSITCITVSVGLFGDVSARFLKGGPDSIGAIAVSAQSIGTLLTAGGALTIAGQEANKRLLNRLHISEQYWHELGAGFSLLLLGSAVCLRFSLPHIATLYSDRGFTNYKQGDFGTAEELYQRALQLNPDDDPTHFRLGLLYEDLQDLVKARSNYQAAARTGIPEAINNLSRLNLLDKKPALAVPFLLKALEQEDKNSPEDQYVLLKNLGWASLQLKDYGDAEERLNAAIKLQKTAHLTETATDANRDTSLPIASPYCLLAQVKTAQSDPKSALTAWETCNAEANPYIPEEHEWAITARQLLKAQDQNSNHGQKSSQ